MMSLADISNATDLTLFEPGLNLAVRHLQVPSDVLKEYLPRLTLVLLNGMVYSEDELITLADEVEGDAPDRESEINPSSLHYTSKKQVEEDEEDDEDDEEGGGVEWTLRKCSAAGLDVIANHYRDDILEALLPHIHTKLTDADWKVTQDLFAPRAVT